jgi:glycogen debranching enzyme
MWTKWGIRTLSASHPAFNPYNYQTGSIWPHDNAIIAMGFKSYGFSAEAARVARAVSEAASHFMLNQLPELYTASERGESDFPVQYMGANVPQAWAAGSVFMLTQAMLGFVPDAPHDRVFVDPALPAWLPDLTVRDLRIGRHKLDIRFWREAEQTAFEVVKGDPRVVERRDIAVRAAELRTASDLAPRPPSKRGYGRRSA